MPRKSLKKLGGAIKKKYLIVVGIIVLVVIGIVAYIFWPKNEEEEEEEEDISIVDKIFSRDKWVSTWGTKDRFANFYGTTQSGTTQSGTTQSGMCNTICETNMDCWQKFLTCSYNDVGSTSTLIERGGPIIQLSNISSIGGKTGKELIDGLLKDNIEDKMLEKSVLFRENQIKEGRPQYVRLVPGDAARVFKIEIATDSFGEVYKPGDKYTVRYNVLFSQTTSINEEQTNVTVVVLDEPDSDNKYNVRLLRSLEEQKQVPEYPLIYDIIDMPNTGTTQAGGVVPKYLGFPNFIEVDEMKFDVTLDKDVPTGNKFIYHLLRGDLTKTIFYSLNKYNIDEVTYGYRRDVPRIYKILSDTYFITFIMNYFYGVFYDTKIVMENIPSLYNSLYNLHTTKGLTSGDYYTNKFKNIDKILKGKLVFDSEEESYELEDNVSHYDGLLNDSLKQSFMLFVFAYGLMFEPKLPHVLTEVSENTIIYKNPLYNTSAGSREYETWKEFGSEAYIVDEGNFHEFIDLLDYKENLRKAQKARYQEKMKLLKTQPSRELREEADLEQDTLKQLDDEADLFTLWSRIKQITVNEMIKFVLISNVAIDIVDGEYDE